jgi:isopentenyl phosphate kinase
LDAGISPVIAPIGMGCKGSSDESVVYNINADVAAGRIAGELRAARVLFLTDIAGVLDKEMKLMDRLSVEDVDALIKDETITGGMIPKGTFFIRRMCSVESCILFMQSHMISTLSFASSFGWSSTISLDTQQHHSLQIIFISYALTNS